MHGVHDSNGESDKAKRRHKQDKSVIGGFVQKSKNEQGCQKAKVKTDTISWRKIIVFINNNLMSYLHFIK